MNESETVFQSIIQSLHVKSGLDFSGYQPAFLRRRLAKRIAALRYAEPRQYLAHLDDSPEEVQRLLDILTVNVSRFFRNPLTFEFFGQTVLPKLLEWKTATGDSSLRVWSAGCSCGEEPYTVAILLKELLRGQEEQFRVSIFATDVDRKALGLARQGRYGCDAVRDVRYGLLRKYFTEESGVFTIDAAIRAMVDFSYDDVADQRLLSPSASVFGAFDVLLCRNLLIYFNSSLQTAVFEKMLRALSRNGFLVLGEAEEPLPQFKSQFRRVNKSCHIYQRL